MKVVVTGSSGKAGRAVVADMRRAGFDVLEVDIAAPLDPDAPSVVADLTDYGQTLSVLEGSDAVIHLAAIPAPNILPDEPTFRINTTSTYNVFAAAVALGLERVVWASSETLIGLPFDGERPRYAPIDEEHPLLPESHYALSKAVGETMAGQFARRSGIPFVVLRYSNIMEPHDYGRFPAFSEDPHLRSWNLWGYVDATDVAQATRLALTTPLTGFEPFLVAAADTCMRQTSSELMGAVFPDVALSRPVEGNETLLSIDKARRVLGYQPAVTWRDFAGQ